MLQASIGNMAERSLGLFLNRQESKSLGANIGCAHRLGSAANRGQIVFLRSGDQQDREFLIR